MAPKPMPQSPEASESTPPRRSTFSIALFAIAVVAFVAAGVFAWGRLSRSSVTPASAAADFVRALEGPEGSDPSTPDRVAPFTEVAASLGLVFEHDNGAKGNFYLPEEMGPGAAFFDFDGDGNLDVFVGGGGVPGEEGQKSRFFRNDSGRFLDVTDTVGVAVPGQVYGVACADFDDDGDVDMYVARLGSNMLLVNDGGGHFVDAAPAAGVDHPGFGASCCFFDYDKDGRLDLYVTNYVDWSPALERACYAIQGRRDYCNPVVYDKASVDALYRNRGDSTFEDVTKRSGIEAESGNGLGVVACDFDEDGWMDLYVANDQTPGFLWHNKGNATFENTALMAGCAFNGDGVAIAGMGIACEDLNADGRFDLFVTNIRDQSHLLLENRGKRFVDRSAPLGLTVWSIPFTAFGIAVFDQDLDGHLDAYIANGAVNFSVNSRYENPYAQSDQFVRLDEGRFVDATKDSGIEGGHVGRGVASGDYDNDGDLDVLVTNNGGVLQLFRNNAEGHWLLVSVRRGKRHAIGARVHLKAGGRAQLREIRPQQSYLTSVDPRAHFGLGDVDRIEELSVVWPDGTKVVRRDVPTDQHLVIPHPDDAN